MFIVRDRSTGKRTLLFGVRNANTQHRRSRHDGLCHGNLALAAATAFFIFVAIFVSTTEFRPVSE
jgi:hypothetical protein